MESWLVEGIIALISGMTTVFVILVLIAVMISLLKYTNSEYYRKKKKDEKEVEVGSNVGRGNVEIVGVGEEEQIVAAVTAAIEMVQGVAMDGLVIRGIRRV